MMRTLGIQGSRLQAFLGSSEELLLLLVYFEPEGCILLLRSQEGIFELFVTHRLHSSSSLGLPDRIF